MSVEPESDLSPRRLHRKGIATRATILRVAERMFAQAGLDGVSLRAITAEAQVDLALVNYHFKSKERLYRKVIVRRAVVINRARLRALDSMERPLTIEAVVDAFVDPLIARLKSRDDGWRYYAALAVQISNSQRFDDLRREYFDPTAELFIDAFSVTAPGVKRQKFYWAYIFMVGCLVQALGATGRFSPLSESAAGRSHSDMAREELRLFIVGGVRRMIEN